MAFLWFLLMKQLTVATGAMICQYFFLQVWGETVRQITMDGQSQRPSNVC